MFGNSAPARPEVHDDRFRQLVESIEDYAIYMLDIAGHVVTWNRGAALNKGYSAAEILGKHYKVFFVPEDLADDLPGKHLREARKTGRVAGEGWRLCKDGQRFWAGFVITAMRDANGKLTGFAKVTRDLTERKRQEDAMRGMENALREERDTLRAASESSMEALFICAALRGADGEIEDFVLTYLNSNVEAMAALPRGAMLGCRLCELFPAVRSQGVFEMLKQVAETGQRTKHEFPNDPHKPSSGWTRVRAVKLRDGIAITACDITERKRHEASLLHRAQHDHLTGLPNRALLDDRLGLAVERAMRYGAKTAVFLVDLDGFKRVNDTLGHAAGDAVLVNASVRLKAAVRGTDSVLRIGGDEFIVVMPDVQEERDIRRMAAKMIAAVLNGGPDGLETVQMSCSIGIAIYPVQADTADELFSKADAAMYQAKRGGGGCFEVYNEATPGFEPKMPVAAPPRRMAAARPDLVAPRAGKSSVTFPPEA